MAIKKIVFLLGILLAITYFSIGMKKNVANQKVKLILYAVIDDSIELHEKDTAWLERDICLILKIDSVDSKLLLPCKNRSDRFYYRGSLFSKSQLFEPKEYAILKKMTISAFDVFIAGRVEPQSVTSVSNCLNSEQKKYIKTYFQTFGLRHGNLEKMKIYFDNIRITNLSLNKSIPKINGVTCILE